VYRYLVAEESGMLAHKTKPAKQVGGPLCVSIAVHSNIGTHRNWLIDAKVH
jgi:hypothetical protein